MDGQINCASCSEIAIQPFTTEVISLKNCKIIIDNVPCYTCTICGETMYFDDVLL